MAVSGSNSAAMAAARSDDDTEENTQYPRPGRLCCICGSDGWEVHADGCSVCCEDLAPAGCRAGHPTVRGRPPTVKKLAELARFPRTPQPGDSFQSKGGHGSPSCVEYTDKAPHGFKLGRLRKDTWLVAKEVDVALLPCDTQRGRPQEWGICIRCDSKLCQGRDCWINISRGRVSFAWLASRGDAGPLWCGDASHDAGPWWRDEASQR